MTTLPRRNFLLVCNTIKRRFNANTTAATAVITKPITGIPAFCDVFSVHLLSVLAFEKKNLKLTPPLNCIN